MWALEGFRSGAKRAFRSLCSCLSFRTHGQIGSATMSLEENLLPLTASCAIMPAIAIIASLP